MLKCGSREEQEVGGRLRGSSRLVRALAEVLLREAKSLVHLPLSGP